VRLRHEFCGRLNVDFETRVDQTIQSAIDRNTIVGAVTVVARDGKIVYRKAAGWFDREAEQPMFPEAIFRLASVTKPLVAATALAMVDRGLLGLDNAVSDHLPWFKPRLPDGTQPKITIRHLLTHTSGLTSNFPRDSGVTGGLTTSDLSLEENFSLHAERVPLNFAPGEGWEYAVNIDVLGAVIERIHGGKLDDAVQQYVARPLEMVDTAFSVPEPKRERLAVPYADGPPGLRRMGDPEEVINPDGGSLIFSPSRIFNPKAFQSGGAGAVGTADDLIKFLEAIRNRGVPILKAETVAQAIQNQVGELPRRPQDTGQRFGFLGAVIADPKAAKRPQAAGSIRWGGVYGHDWFIDFTNGISAMMMTNTSLEGCNGNYPKDVARAIYGS
jgi:CubicO group peptidase (beta-lactamase class C family)